LRPARGRVGPHPPGGRAGCGGIAVMDTARGVYPPETSAPGEP
jgi:hypothetical protein